MKLHWPLLLPLLIFLLCAGFFASALVNKNAPQPAPHMVGQPAPVFQDMPRPAFINIFASWCLPCEAEHPAITRLHEQGIPVYGVNYKDDPARAAAFLERLGNPYRMILPDPDGKIALDLGMRGLPTSFIVDEEGMIAARFDMAITPDMVENTILPQIRGMMK